VRPRPRASHRVVSRAVYQAHGLPRAQARHLVHAVGMPNSHLATTHVETVEAAGDPDGVGGAVLVGEDLGLHGSGRDNALDEGHCQHAWLVGEALGLWRDEDSADLGLGRLGAECPVRRGDVVGAQEEPSADDDGSDDETEKDEACDSDMHGMIRTCMHAWDDSDMHGTAGLPGNLRDGRQRS